MQTPEERVFGKLRVAARHADDAHDVHRHKDGIDAYEGDPEVKLAQTLIH